jgi:hypothetical protein
VKSIGMDPAPGPGFYWNVLVQEVIGFIGPPMCDTVDVYGPGIPECLGDWASVPQDESAIGTAVEVKGYYNPPYQVFLCGGDTDGDTVPDYFIRPLDSTPNPCPTVTPTATATPSPTTPTPTVTPSPTTPTPTVTPVPTPPPPPPPQPGAVRPLYWDPGWHNETWSGASPPEDVFACAAGKYAAAYRLVDGGWERYFPSWPNISDMTPLEQYDTFFILVTADVICQMPVADPASTERTLDWDVGWHNDAWSGDSATPSEVFSCADGKYSVVYSLVNGVFERFVTGMPLLSTIGSVDEYDAFLILMTDDVACSMPVSADHALPSPTPSAGPSPTPSPGPSPTPSPTPCVPTVEISVDKGEGATYCIGDPIQWCTQVSCPTYVYLYKILEGQPPALFASGATEGRECHWSEVGEPAGVHTLRVEARDGGQVLASDDTWFTASSCVSSASLRQQ